MPTTSAPAQASPSITSKTPPTKTMSFWKKHRWIWIGIGVLCIVLSVGLLYSYVLPGNDGDLSYRPGATPTPTPTPVPKDRPDPLNGVLYTAQEAEAFARLRPMAVMVENHVEARPQSGLQDAEILYEAMAEGGITRFMAVFLADNPDKIGPVRSARLHFVDWASEYDAVYAHWGGSAEAQAFLQSTTRPKNLDQFFNAGAFYRDYSGGKSLEHTGYTSIALLRQVATQKNWEQSVSFESWAFKDDALAANRGVAQTVTLNFLGTAGYQGVFTYRPETNDYARSTGGQIHVDSQGLQLTAKTIVLQYQPVTNYTDTSGHSAVTVQTTGSGKAVVIEDGVAQEGAWHKSSRNVRTTFTDVNGKPLNFNRGKVWVVSVPAGSSATY